MQFEDSQITLGKNADSFAPVGPWVVTADEIDDPSALHVATYADGEMRQLASTSSWLSDVPALIEFLSQPPPWPAPGDEVTVEVTEIGRLTNPVVAGWAR